ncbi:MAG: 50S ribosomal protein L3 [Mycoplasmataceae bacterium]|nr:MAG: 50S ribosomal protein L3 [Mycoplasmataceae bacterium]
MLKTIGILGKKQEMTQLPEKGNGRLSPVTAIWVGGNVVSQVKTEEKEGYNACQVAFSDCKEKSLNKPLVGHLKKVNISSKKYLREIRDMSGLEIGSQVDLSLFKEGDEVKVTGTSKGKGTAGVIKRYGFKIGNKSHGGGYPHRQIGSMGGGRGTNQGVPKGKKMPGRMGHERVTQNAIVEKIDLENQIIFIRGAIPGPKQGLIVLRKFF